MSVLLGPYHESCLKGTTRMSSCDFSGESCANVIHMSSRISVQSHRHFEHYLQSLCHVVLYGVRNLTRIVSWSLPMRLFVRSTAWFSILILKVNWHPTAAALNSWPYWLWIHNRTSQLSSNHLAQIGEYKSSISFCLIGRWTTGYVNWY